MCSWSWVMPEKPSRGEFSISDVDWSDWIADGTAVKKAVWNLNVLCVFLFNYWKILSGKCKCQLVSFESWGSGVEQKLWNYGRMCFIFRSLIKCFLCFYIVLCSFTISDIISSIVLDAHFEMYSLNVFFCFVYGRVGSLNH